MDISRMKKLFAGVSAVAISLTSMGTAFAAYSDVPAGVWYEDAVDAFTDAGYLDKSQTRFRGGDNANRAEFIKLVVELNGGILSTAPAVPSFDDTPKSAWFYNYMEEAAKEGWVKGDNNCYGSHPCYARPGANINRAEAAALIVRAFGLDATGDAPNFVDVPNGQWYTDAVQTAADHCVLQGDDTTGRARPADFMNRAEMVVMLHRVDQGLQFGVDCGEVAEPMITDVTATSATTVEVEFNMALDEDAMMDVSHYMVSGDDEIDVASVDMIDSMTVELTLATSLAANGDYTLSVEDMMTAEGDEFSDTMDFSGYSPIAQGNGTLEVSLSSSNPASDTVPKGSQGVVMLSIDLTASCDDSVVISQVTALHEGFGDTTDITGLFAAVDGERISRKRSLDSQDQTADLRFVTPLTIPACQTKTLDIVGDFSSTATTAAEHNFAVELPSDFQSNALDVTGNFPARGNTFRMAAVTSGNLTVAYRTVSPDQVEVGDKQVVVGKFELSTDAVEDQTIYSMTFEQNGSAGDGDITNIAVRRSDKTMLTNVAAATVGDFVTLVFDPPFTILEGDKITLEVVADVEGGAGDNVVMHFEETSDIFAVGSLYGYGVNGQLYGSRITLPTESSTLPDTITIDAGQFTIEVDGPVQQKFTRDADDAVLAKILMTTGGEALDVKRLYIAIQAQTSTGGGLTNVVNTSYDNVHEILEDVELRNTKTGQTVSAVRLTDSSSFGTGLTSTSSFQIYRFDDFTVEGDETYELRVDFIDNGASNHPKSGDRFRIHICGEPTQILSSGTLTSNSTGCNFGGIIANTTTTTWNMEIEGLSTGDNVGDVRPRGTITGNFHRIASASLNIAVKAIGVTDTAVRNSKNTKLFQFEARAGEAEDILFTKAIFRSESGSLLNGQNYALWADTDGDGGVDTMLQNGVAAQSSQVSFNELAGGGFVIPAEDSVIFEVHADIAASLSNNDLLLAFDTGSSVTYVEAEEVDDGSSLSGIQTTTSTNVTTDDSSCTSSCDILVSVTRSKLWLLSNQGDLFVSRDTSPRSHQLLGGSLGDAVLRLRFRAQNEDVSVTDLQFNGSGSTTTANDVERLDLYKDNATTPFASATIGGCGTDDVLGTNPGGSSAAIQAFCANMENNQFVVTKGVDAFIEVRPRMKSDESGAKSNQTIQLWITKQAVSNNTTGSGSVRARGMQSSNNLDANSGDAAANGEIFIGTNSVSATNSDIVGNINKTVLSKIASITNVNTDADNTNVPTSTSPIGRFKFTAASNTNSLNGLNKATLSGIIFNVNATNVNLNGSNFKFYNIEDTSTKQSCSAFNSAGTAVTGVASGSLTVLCKSLKASTIDVSMDSGEAETFVLEGDITNPKVGTNTSNLQVSLQDFTTLTTTTFAYNASHIDWFDEDAATLASATTTGRFYWIEYPETQIKSTSYKS